MNKQEALEEALSALRESKSNHSTAMKAVLNDRAVAFIRLAEAMDGAVRNIKEPTP